MSDQSTPGHVREGVRESEMESWRVRGMMRKEMVE